MPAQMPCNVYDLADKIKTRNFFSFHCFGRELMRINAAFGHFRGSKALCTCGFDMPGIDHEGEVNESGIAHIGEA